MDELVSEFVEETNDSLDIVDQQLVEFEKNPDNQEILANIFRLLHTIKGTCGFLGMGRLEKIAHAGESLIGKFREGKKVTKQSVNLVLQAIDCTKNIINAIAVDGKEPQGDDAEIIKDITEECEMMDGDKANVKKQIKKTKILIQKNPPQKKNNTSHSDVSENTKNNVKKVQEEIEKQLQKIKQKKNKQQDDKKDDKSDGNLQKTIRVNVNTLENLMNAVRELMLTRNQLQDIIRKSNDTKFTVPVQNLSSITAGLQETVMKTRMQPIGNAWQKLPRIVRDLSNGLQKQVNLVMQGEDTELDRQILELIRDPLTHMVRNCVDHAIEKPQDREKNGKKPQGQIKLAAKHQEGHIIIEISDDGAGLDVDKIRQKSIEKNIVSAEKAHAMTSKKICDFIFHPGFSTAEKVTNISGRGVGMDVVRSNIEIIGGAIEISTKKGQGTKFSIKIPLTLAIVSSLIVGVGQEKFAIPQLSVIEIVRAGEKAAMNIETIKDKPVIRLRNQLLPLMGLDEILQKDKKQNRKSEKNDTKHIVVIKVGSKKVGIIVDNVFDNEEIVVKPVSQVLRGIPVYSGVTILGDGSVIMILEPNSIFQEFFACDSEQLYQNDNEQTNDKQDQMFTKMLLFYEDKRKNTTPMALPLEVITRIEKIETDKIEQSGKKMLVKYRGKLMKLVFLKQSDEMKSGKINVLVFTRDKNYLGLVIGDIIDIVEEKVDFEANNSYDGIFCTAIIAGRATNIVDAGYYFFDEQQDSQIVRNAIPKQKDQQETVKNKNIILIDDSAFFRNMITPILSAAGYNITKAKSAVDALEIITASKKFDVVISDIEMPNMNGVELAKELRNIQQYKKVPFIALSGIYSSRVLDKDGSSSGFDYYVAKFDRKGLLELLKEITYQGKAA